MRKLVRGSLFIGAAAGAIALSAPPAFASGWTVVNPNPDGHWVASLRSGTTASFRDASSNQAFICPSSTIRGTAPSGTGLSNPYARITSSLFANCTGPQNSTATVSFNPVGINGMSYDASTDSVGGNITGFTGTITFKDLLGTCTATLSGSLNDVVYANAGGTFRFIPDTVPNLTFTSATGTGCAGLIRAGDKVSFGATYVVTDPVPPFTVRPS